MQSKAMSKPARCSHDVRDPWDVKDFLRVSMALTLLLFCIEWRCVHEQLVPRVKWPTVMQKQTGENLWPTVMPETARRMANCNA